jgi:TPR repeat protein
MLGWMYNFGKGVPRDDTEAVKWYLKAAEQGYAKAQFNLAVAYARGEGLLQSGGTAADWYYKAGLSYLKKGKKDNALRCVERIKYLKKSSDLSESKALLADKLLTSIHGDVTSKTPPAPGKNQK